MLQVILAKSYQDAKEVASVGVDWVAIETEYGENTLGEEHENVSLGLNHHGEFQLNDAPALCYKKGISKKHDNFIISHIDLDVLFGILWSAGWLKKTTITETLSNLVAIADVNGFHTVEELLIGMDDFIVERYLSIGYLVNSWVINDNGLTRKDVSKEIHKLLLRIKDIIRLGATPEQIASYKQWLLKQQGTSKKFLQESIPLIEEDNLFIYRAPFSLTTAYNIGDLKSKVIVQYNEQSKSITLGCYNEEIAKKYFGENGVIEPLQLFFGGDAGGKFTIGGTSREANMQPEMLEAFVDFLKREYFNIPFIQKIRR